MRPALLLLVLAAGCREQGPHGVAPPPSDTATRPAPGSGSAGSPVLSTDQATCADKWLSEHQFDSYGNPKSTNYIGGTPGYDERTGQTIDRWVLVAKNRPEALRACGVSPP